MRLETSERDCFVRMDVKDGEEPRNLDNIANMLRKIQELHFSACVTDCHIGGHQLADPGAIDIIDIGEIEKNVALPTRDHIAHHLPQHRSAFSQLDFAAEIDNADVVRFAICSQ